jgi:hypothetical protein
MPVFNDNIIRHFMTIGSTNINCNIRWFQLDILCATVCILFGFLYNTMMMVAEATETCCYIVIHDKHILSMYSYWLLYKYNNIL